MHVNVGGQVGLWEVLFSARLWLWYEGRISKCIGSSVPFDSLGHHLLLASHREAALATLTRNQQEQMWAVLDDSAAESYHLLLRTSDHSASRSVCTAGSTPKPQPIPGMAPGLSSQFPGSS